MKSIYYALWFISEKLIWRKFCQVEFGTHLYIVHIQFSVILSDPLYLVLVTGYALYFICKSGISPKNIIRENNKLSNGHYFTYLIFKRILLFRNFDFNMVRAGTLFISFTFCHYLLYLWLIWDLKFYLFVLLLPP